MCRGKFRQEGPRVETDAQGPLLRRLSGAPTKYSRLFENYPNPFNPRPRSSGNKPEIRVADMAKANIDFQVLVPSNGSFYYDVEAELGLAVCSSYNNAIGRIIKKYPGKFLGLATLPMQTSSCGGRIGPRRAPTGPAGFVCYTTVGDKDLDGEEFWPVFAKAEELAIPIIFHPVNTGPIVGLAHDAPLCHSRLWFLERLGNSMENSSLSLT